MERMGEILRKGGMGIKNRRNKQRKLNPKKFVKYKGFHLDIYLPAPLVSAQKGKIIIWLRLARIF